MWFDTKQNTAKRKSGFSQSYERKKNNWKSLTSNIKLKKQNLTCWTCARNVSNWASVQQTLPLMVRHIPWIFDESRSSGWETWERKE